MVRRHSILLSFILATLAAAGGVELFYRSLDTILTGDNEGVQTTAAAKNDAGANTSASLRSKTSMTKPAGKNDYTIIIKRSLFGKVAAKAIEKPPEPEPVLTTTSLDLILLGTIGGETNDQRAFIRNKKDNTQEIYYKGDAIQHAFIKEIGRGQIILTVNGKDEVLLMEESKSPKGSAKNTDHTTEVYSLADAMEKETRSKPTSKQKSRTRKDKTLKLEQKLR